MSEEYAHIIDYCRTAPEIDIDETALDGVYKITFKELTAEQIGALIERLSP